MKFKVKHKGFTLIEFVVIISIFAIMAGVALINFAGFRSNVGLNNLSHDIALTIRQAQVFGWAAQTQNGDNQGVGEAIQLDSVNGNPVRYADGVYFEYTNGAFSKDFILYTKNNSEIGREYYESTDREIDRITIQGPNHISSIQYANSKESLLLPPDHTIPGNSPLETFSVAFSRPHPEAMFFSGSGALNQLGPQSAYVGIYISGDTDPAGTAEHVITISRFGEIAVQ